MSSAAGGHVTVRAVTWADAVAAELRTEQEAELHQRYADVLAVRAVPALAPLDVQRALGFWIAEDARTGEALGCAALQRPDPATESADGYRSAEVKRVYVRAASRGRGVATRLMAAVSAAAVGLGCDRLVLSTGPRQPEAAGLYRRLGWQRIPNYGENATMPTVLCFEQPLWADPPPLSVGPSIRHRRSARALVFDPADRLLLTRNLVTAEGGITREYWALPGGGIEADEDAGQAAARELGEETGLQGIDLDGPVVSQQYWVAFPTVLDQDRVLHQIEQLWWGRADTDRVSRDGLHADEDYLVALRWWTLTDLRATDCVTFPRLLPDLAESLLAHGTPSEPFVIVSDSTHPPGRPVADTE